MSLSYSLDVLAPLRLFPHGHPVADCAQLILDVGCLLRLSLASSGGARPYLVQVPVLQVMEERPGLALSSLFPPACTITIFEGGVKLRLTS